MCATNPTNRLQALISIKTPIFSEGGIVAWLQQDRPLCVGKLDLPSPSSSLPGEVVWLLFSVILCGLCF